MQPPQCLPQPKPEAKPRPLPRKLGKYLLLSELGKGATSTVYLAEDPFHQRKVAIKVVEMHETDEAMRELADVGMRT